MYTWGYIKEATLAKLDVSNTDAVNLGYMNRFYIYANEAIGQISSAVKAKLAYATFKAVHKERLLKYLSRKYQIIDFTFLHTTPYNVEDLPTKFQACLKEYKSYVFVNDVVKMPDDYIAFSLKSKAYVTRYEYYTNFDRFYIEENKTVADNDCLLYGSQSVKFIEPGLYEIPYNARWFIFSSTTPDDLEIPVPSMILDALPSYIASQIFKIDDEQKAAIMRNEFEIFVSRINDNDDSEPESIVIGGDW
jgi:hypothetical protein